jgi:hypothetical protein
MDYAAVELEAEPIRAVSCSRIVAGGYKHMFGVDISVVDYSQILSGDKVLEAMVRSVDVLLRGILLELS